MFEGDQVATGVADERVIEVTEAVVPAPAEASSGAAGVVAHEAPADSASATADLVIDLRPSDDDDLDAEPQPIIGERVDPALDGRDVLQGRVAVVTGGASGVGREVALGLARAGARVCVLGRDVAELRQTVEQAGPAAAILYLQCDVGSVSEIEGVVDFISRFDRPVDLLVHAEGVQVRGGIEHGSVNDLDEQYLVNVRGPYLMSQQLTSQLRSGAGHVVFVIPAPISPNAVDAGQFVVTSEAATALASTLRNEVAESGVRVTSVRPEIPTPSNIVDSVAALTPAEIADAVLFAVTAPASVEITDVRLRPVGA